MNKATLRSTLRTATPGRGIRLSVSEDGPAVLRGVNNLDLRVRSMSVGKGRGGTINVVAITPSNSEVLISTKQSEMIDEVLISD